MKLAYLLAPLTLNTPKIDDWDSYNRVIQMTLLNKDHH